MYRIIIIFFLTKISFSQELLKISKKEFLIENEADSGSWKAIQKGTKLFNAFCRASQPQGTFKPDEILSTTLFIPVAFVNFSIESPNPFDFSI